MTSASGQAAEPASATGFAGPWPAVSVVLAVRNEERHLAAAVGQVLSQDYPGAIEVVIAVGPSRDATARVAEGLAAADPRVTVVPSPLGLTPVGLNLAIEASSNPVIVRVDGHSILPPGYIRQAVALLHEQSADNVGGIMAAEGETAFEQAVAVAMRSKVGVGSARFHNGGDAGPADTVYLGVFRRSTLERLGGYDERFVRAQDAELNVRIRRSGGLVWFTPDLRVTYRPRSTYRALGQQYFNYGRWRRVLMRTHPSSVRGRYLAPPAALLGVGAGLVLGAALSPVFLLLPGGYLLGVLAASAGIGRGLGARARLLLPTVVVTMHMAWAAGFLTSPRSLIDSVEATMAGQLSGEATETAA